MALIVGFALLCLAARLLFFKAAIDWKTDGRWIDGGSCLVFAGVLFWWARSKKTQEHEPNSTWKIGNDTVTMVVTVVTAVIAILALVHEASN